MNAFILAIHHFRTFKERQGYWIFWGCIWAYQALMASAYFNGANDQLGDWPLLALFAALVYVTLFGPRHSTTNNAFLKTRPLPRLTCFLVDCVLPFCLYITIPLLREVPIVCLYGFGFGNLMWAWFDHLALAGPLFFLAWQLGILVPRNGSPSRWGFGVIAAAISFALFYNFTRIIAEKMGMFLYFDKSLPPETYYFTIVAITLLLVAVCVFPVMLRLTAPRRATYLILVLLPIFAGSYSFGPGLVQQGLTRMDLWHGSKQAPEKGLISADNYQLTVQRENGGGKVRCWNTGLWTQKMADGKMVLPTLREASVWVNGKRCQGKIRRLYTEPIQTYAVESYYGLDFALKNKFESKQSPAFQSMVTFNYSTIEPLLANLTQMDLTVDAVAEKGRMITKGIKPSSGYTIARRDSQIHIDPLRRQWKMHMGRRSFGNKGESSLTVNYRRRSQNLHLKRLFKGCSTDRNTSYALVLRDKGHARGELIFCQLPPVTQRIVGAFTLFQGKNSIHFTYNEHRRYINGKTVLMPNTDFGRRNPENLVLDILEFRPELRWSEHVSSPIRFGRAGIPGGERKTFLNLTRRDPLQALQLMAEGKAPKLYDNEINRLGDALSAYDGERIKDLLFAAAKNHPELCTIIVANGWENEATDVWLDLVRQGGALPVPALWAFFVSKDERLLNALLDQQRRYPSLVVLSEFQLLPDWWERAFKATQESLDMWQAFTGKGDCKDIYRRLNRIRSCGVRVQHPWYGQLATEESHYINFYLPYMDGEVKDGLKNPDRYWFDDKRMCLRRKEKSAE